jgi:hypothetical protein
MPDDGRSTDNRPSPAGQIWLIETTADGCLAAGDRDALVAADIVLYDAALTALVSNVLPANCYAEAFHLADASKPAISPRALNLVADGWRVVVLVRPRAQRKGGSPNTIFDAGPADPMTTRVSAAAKAFTANGLAG